MALLLITSCSNESVDETENAVEASLLGEWVLLNLEVNQNADIFQNGVVTSSTETSVTTTEQDYKLIFTESNFTTSGSYTVNVQGSINDQSVVNQSNTVSNIEGNGTYELINSEQIRFNGALYQFDFEGVQQVQANEGEPAKYEFSEDGNQLTFTDESQELTTLNGNNARVTSNSVSVWVRGNAEARDACLDAETITSIAQEALNEATSEAYADACAALKVALENQIEICGDSDGALQTRINALGDCTEVFPLLVQAVATYEDGETTIINYIYEGRRLIREDHGDGFYFIYNYLNDRLVGSDSFLDNQEDIVETYEYDDNGVLNRITVDIVGDALPSVDTISFSENNNIVDYLSGSDTSFRLTLENSNVIKYEEFNENSVENTGLLTYDDKNGPFKNIEFREVFLTIDTENIYSVAYGLNNVLTEEYENENCTYSYTYNALGYPTQIIENGTDGEVIINLTYDTD